ncbi:aldo/keto reductase [Halomarina ordinaria]|uniref:Aldo/keto reductase n=1 Tax=Halomarina ordinaria TaxID=3033939 RepID=A0ABD5UHQ9_9EURY|nr:aldo/keto reductase [Halomarina sp. PSRA2]
MSLSTVPLGRTGTTVSGLSFGTWRFGRETDTGELEVDRDQAHRLLSAYAEAGGNFIDTADMYGDGLSEEWIGDWLEGRDREDFVVASKVYWPTREDDPNGRGIGRKHLRRQVDRILDRLGTDYLDVLYCHRFDDQTPPEEFMRTLDGFVDDGRVNYLGASTFEPNAWEVARANEIADRRGYEPFTLAQPRYNLVNREIEGNYVEMCEAYDLGLCPWSPLAGGFLTGKYEREGSMPEGTRGAESDRFADRYLSEANFDALDVVRDVAEEVGATPAQVSVAWLMHHPQVTAPIVGARTVDQLEENLAADEVSLTDEQFERLAEAKEYSPMG